MTDNSLLGIIGIQIDNTIILKDRKFNNKESQKIIFKYKAKTEFKKGIVISFNKYITIYSKDDIIIII